MFELKPNKKHLIPLLCHSTKYNYQKQYYLGQRIEIMAKYYLDFFRENRRLDYIDKEKFYNNLKLDIMNHKTYKWSVRAFVKMIEENNLDFENSVKVMQWLKKEYSSSNEGFKNLVNKLEKKSKNFISKKNLIVVKTPRENFLEDLQEFRIKHLKMNSEEFLNFIINNFKIDIERASLRDIYYQKIK